MMLSDGDLQEALDEGCLKIDPPGVMQPASIDLHLADTLLIFGYTPRIWPKNPANTHELMIPQGESWPLAPGMFVLASTVQTIDICQGYAARVEGKSSLGRLGLMVHSTAGFIDPGFRGQITLELSNVNSSTIMLTPGMAIAQLCVFELKTPARKPYGHPDNKNRYQGQRGPTASRSWMGLAGGSSPA
jgi:dCTP deaminase